MKLNCVIQPWNNFLYTMKFSVEKIDRKKIKQQNQKALEEYTNSIIETVTVRNK
tara:strand:- start:376 stop:537 length:162 start_codon:yes stop_codon:yes gene_type:complete